MKEKNDLMKKNAGSEVSGPGFATHYFYVMSQNMAQGTVQNGEDEVWRKDPKDSPSPWEKQTATRRARSPGHQAEVPPEDVDTRVLREP